MRPPDQLDGATVVFWAWSGERPFFEMSYSDGSGGIPIHGLAVCQYDDSKAVYRFSCDSQWEVQNDSDYESIEEAKSGLSGLFDIGSVEWRRWTASDGAVSRVTRRFLLLAPLLDVVHLYRPALVSIPSIL